MTPVQFEWFVGDSITIKVAARWKDTALPVDLTGAKIRATAEAKTLGAVWWTKTDASNGGSDAEILVDLPATLGTLTVFATAAESRQAVPGSRYLFDVVAQFPDGTEATLAYGEIRTRLRPSETVI